MMILRWSGIIYLTLPFFLQCDKPQRLNFLLVARCSLLLCYFHVWCKSRELRGRGNSRFPCVAPVVESFFSDFLRARISYWEESHLESCQASTMEPSCENNQRP